MHKETMSAEHRDSFRTIYEALLEQKYDPIRQIRGYILSNDPTYIPDHKNARELITKIDRAVLLDDLLAVYFNMNSALSEKAGVP